MMKSESESYKAAGVDITAGYASVELMKKHVARTMTAGCGEGIGGFGGLFALDAAGMEEPVLVSGTDGVSTKLKIAMLLDKHDTIGIDCVAMCVNDVICCGAKPLFFLDYIACGKNVPEKIASIVAGVAEGCVQAESALIGGETAEHPGMMPEDDYDLAGFSVGIVDKKRIINRETVRPGDVMLALPSTGVHSNGFSLVRKVFAIGNGGENRNYPELDKSLWETLLTPTKIYVKPVLALLKELQPKAISHITGGGTNLQAIIDAKRAGKIPSAELTLVVASNASAYALTRAETAGIAHAVLRKEKGEAPENYGERLLTLLRENAIDVVVLAGFLTILPENVIRAYDHRILNIHPSLIPSFCGDGFYGLHVHEAALKRGVKVTGATVHFVNEITDGGDIIAQKAVEVLPGDTPETLQRRVMEQAEWILLPQALEQVAGEIAKKREEKQ